jgi:hypothetical protein
LRRQGKMFYLPGYRSRGLKLLNRTKPLGAEIKEKKKLS